MARILVVEDSRLSRRMVVKVLENAGHVIIEATNGKEGLELFRKEDPDCVVTDLLMPVMDGQEMLAHIRKIDSSVPVIVASADIQRTSRINCELLGISGFLNKPVQTEPLLACVNEAITLEVGVHNNEPQ